MPAQEHFRQNTSLSVGGPQVTYRGVAQENHREFDVQV